MNGARMDESRTALYRHRDKNGTLLYVGISLSVASRLAQHAATSHWFAEVAHVEVEYFPNRKDAGDAEKRAIRTEYPRCNIAHALTGAGQPVRPKQAAVAVPPARPATGILWQDGQGHAKDFMRRWTADLRRAAAPHRLVFDVVQSRYPEDTEFLDLGHRFWLTLTDDEFAAAAHCVLATEFTIFSDIASDGYESWTEAAEHCWSEWWSVWECWADKRATLAERWPALARAA